MASESTSDSQYGELIKVKAPSIAPPRLPPPAGLQLPNYQDFDSRPWNGAGSHFPHARPSNVSSLDAAISEQRTAASRHLLPLLDTSQSSHRLLQTNQLPLSESGQLPNKRRRVDGSQRTVSPNLVSRLNLSADSSSPAADYRQERHDTQQHSSQIHSDTLNHAAWRSHAVQASRDAVCCSPGCQGLSCTRLRSIVQDLVTEICTRDAHVSGAPLTSEYLPPKPILPEATEIETSDALEWALQRLRWNNASLRTLLSTNLGPLTDTTPPEERRVSFSSSLERMKRHHEAVDKDIEPSPHHPRSFQLPATEQHSAQNTPLIPDSWRPFEGMDPPGQPPLRHYRSSSFSFGPPQPSPSQTASAARMLPSPSSLNLPLPPQLPPISSPTPLTPSAAHLAHLQDLQHQVSVKQLALQTLQREYDSLLQKLERQRIKSLALEKKFEVSDAEINSLTDEKERLASQVLALEAQVEELQVSRDEARKMGADSAAQYMKIVEMAGRLQGKGVEDKKGWEKERDTLLRRIAELEGSSAGVSRVSSTYESPGGMESAPSPLRQLSEPVAALQLSRGPYLGVQQQDDTTMLRQEILNLKGRIAALEAALKEALDESKAVREAALSLASAGQRLEKSATSALGRPAKSEEDQ